MFTFSPQATIASYNASNSDVQNNYIYSSIRSNMQELLGNLSVAPTTSKLIEACNYIKESTEISLTRKQIEEILTLYPFARIKLALYPLDDSDVQEELINSIANFFIGVRRWPTHGDNIDIIQFTEIIKKQADLMGYHIES